jgi:hypothetical protein
MRSELPARQGKLAVRAGYTRAGSNRGRSSKRGSYDHAQGGSVAMPADG